MVKILASILALSLVWALSLNINEVEEPKKEFIYSTLGKAAKAEFITTILDCKIYKIHIEYEAALYLTKCPNNSYLNNGKQDYAQQ